ncbi:MAG TPA: methyltransferase [Candidatus Limnocylindria bacterium]|nr:methyltransferase [Candidatus Limnocylindria bacterium]
MNTPAGPSPQRIQQFAWGYTSTLIIQAAVEHRIFDLLHVVPRTLEELVVVSGTSMRGLRALMGGLIGLELVVLQGDRYALTPESATFLVSSSPASMGAFFHHSGRQLIPAWLKLPEAVQTGRPAERVNAEGPGAKFFADFVESLFPMSFPVATLLGEHLGIAHAQAPLSVLDLGAGSGVWGIALAKQSSQVRIRAVDWPKVLEVTRKVANRHGLADRLTLAPGDFATADFGSGHHVATIGHILHSEGVERSKALLKKTFDALAPGGTVAIMEFLLNDDRQGPPPSLIFAINMLVNTDEGDAFSFAEISAWLLEVGFLNPRLLPGPGVSPLVLATKPG